MKLRLFSLVAVLAVFSIYSTMVVLGHGYTGFMELAMSGGWATQVFLDLCIALILFAFWMFGDAKEHGIPAWPYLIVILFTGSIGALAYLIHRTLRGGSQVAAPHHVTV